MAVGKTLRLNKVLRELNISLDRAVEHLANNGYQVEARPTTKISQEEYQVLLDGFETDASKKAASKEVGEEKRKEKEALRLELEAKLEKQKEEEAKKEEILKAKSEKIEFKPVGKIDLDGDKEKEEPKVAEQPEAKEEPKASESVKEEPAKEEEKEAPKKDTDSDVLTTKYKKLDGPKIVKDKKIDLKQFEKPNKKPKEDKKDDANKENRKKRKRITKPYGGGGQQGNRRNQGNNRGRGQQRPAFQKEEPTEAEIQKQIRETLEKLQGKSSKGKGAKYRREKRDAHRQQSEAEMQAAQEESKI